MLKYGLAFLSLFFLSLNAASNDKTTPIELIYKHRLHIVDVLQHLNYGTSFSDTGTVPVRYFSMMRIKPMLDSNFSCWKKNKGDILQEFLNGYIPEANKHKKYRFYIQDSIIISILISFLDYPDYRKRPEPRNREERWEYLEKPEPNWVRDALSILTYEVYFNSLEKQSSEIVDRLSRCKEPELEKLKLLVFCKVSADFKRHKRDSLNNAKRFLDSSFKTLYNSYDSAIKAFDSSLDKSNRSAAYNLYGKYTDSLRSAWKLREKEDSLKRQIDKMERIPLWLMACLGDTLAEKKILLGLRHDNGDILRSYAREASLVWSNPCKTAFLALFNNDHPICTLPDKYVRCRSLQDSLLINLARRHPDDPMFGNFLSANRYNADFCKPEQQVAYFMEFSKWAKKNYGVEIIYQGFKPYFIKDVSKDNAGIRDFCQ